MEKIIASSIDEIAKMFNSYMHSYRPHPFYGADFVVYSGKDVNNFSLIYEIRDGDWKHDHLAFRDLVFEYFFWTYEIEFNQIITEESDGDWYSAEYHINFEKRI